VETFTQARGLEENPGFARARQKSILELDPGSIDGPIADILAGFAALPHCYTLQCCCGHFLYRPGQGRHNIDRIPPGFSGLATCRIAYLAFCLENSPRGQALLQSLAQLATDDSDYVQFGSADWFWERWTNSYVLQVTPKAHMLKDEAILDATGALQTQAAIDQLFRELRGFLEENGPMGR